MVLDDKIKELAEKESWKMWGDPTNKQAKKNREYFVYAFLVGVKSQQDYICKLEEKLTEVEDRKMLDFAIQQFTGYSSCYGGQGGAIQELVNSMGLKKDEWNKIKDECSFLIDNDIKEIEELIANEE